MGFGRDLINSHEGLLKLQDWELKVGDGPLDGLFSAGRSDLFAVPERTVASCHAPLNSDFKTKMNEGLGLFPLKIFAATIRFQVLIRRLALRLQSSDACPCHQGEKSAEVF